MQLSEHFTLNEMQRTSVRGVDNSVPELFIPRLKALCEMVLEPIRRQFGPVFVLSGYRSPRVNRAVGGSTNSQHKEGEAADFVVMCPGTDLYSVARWIAENLTFDQLILEFIDETGTAGWIHISYTTTRENRGTILIARRSKIKGVGTQYQKIKVTQIPKAVSAKAV